MADLRILVTLTDQASAGLRALEGNLKSLGTSAGIAGVAMTAGLTAPIAAAGALGVSFANLQQRAEIGFGVMLGSAEAAKAMMQDLADFAAATPFELKELIPLAQRLRAVGFEASNVIPILQAAGDAAALGTNPAEAINRITLALGQMHTAGRVNAQDMKQLTEANIPAWQILADTLGKTTAETRKMVENGLVPADYAVQALVQGIEKGTSSVTGLGGTMQKLSKTASGALSNLKDAADQALGALMTPALEAAGSFFLAILPPVQSLTGAFLAMDANMRIFITGVGATIAALGPLLVLLAGAAVVISSISGPVGLAVIAITGLAAAFGLVASAVAANFGGLRDTIAGYIEPLIGAAQSWGSNMIQAFADGMAAAIDAVIAVINAITSILAAWFAPGSPPKVAPDIDKWGSATMQEWIGGFSKADFSVFNDLAGLVEEELRNAFSATGGFNLFDAIMGTREGIAGALNDIKQFGDIGEDSMNRIRDAAGPVADVVEQQVRLYGELERATRDVEAAEKDLDRIRRDRDQKLKPIDRELQAIQDQKDALEDQKALADLAKKQASGKLKPGESDKIALDIKERALRAQKREIERSSRDEENQAKDRLDAAKDAEMSVKDQIEAQKDLSGVIKDNIALWDEFHKAAAGGGGGGGAKGVSGLAGAKLNLPNPEKIKQDIDDTMKKIGDAFAPLDKLKEKFPELSGAASTMLGTLVPILARIPEEINKVLNPAQWPDLVADFKILATNIGTWLHMVADDPQVGEGAYSVGVAIATALGNFFRTSAEFIAAVGAMLSVLVDWLIAHEADFVKIGVDIAKGIAAGIKDSVADWFKQGFQEGIASVDWGTFIAGLFPIVMISQKLGAALGGAVASAIQSAVSGGQNQKPDTSKLNQPNTSGTGFNGEAPVPPSSKAVGGSIDAYTPYLVHKNEIIWSKTAGYVQRAGERPASGRNVSVAVHIPQGAVNLDGLSDAELSRFGTRIGGHVLKGFNDALESRVGGTE